MSVVRQNETNAAGVGDLLPASSDGVVRRALSRCGAGCHLAGRATLRGVVEFYRSNNLTFAASIAYYALLSLFPFLLLLLTLGSKLAFSSRATGEAALQQIIARALPSHFEFVVKQLQDMAGSSVNLSVAGTIITLWGSMGVFGAITTAVNYAWGVERSYGFLKHKLIAFLMMMTAGLVAVTALALVSVVHVVESNWFVEAIARVPEWSALTGLVYVNLPTPMFMIVVGLIFYFVPNAQVRVRDVWFSAILTGLLWRGAFEGFAWYVRDFSRFSVHGSIGAVVAFLVWVYLCAVILLYGVEVTAAHARLRKRLPQQVPAAPAREA